ncbi:hypothetical protein HT031_001427 [Scenedesmus sp. PABB004]|nr:hypothetical protein HT031_001427 [Scenedesmus sp. PABB004]
MLAAGVPGRAARRGGAAGALRERPAQPGSGSRPAAPPAAPRRGGAAARHRRGSRLVVGSGLEGFLGLSAFLKPEVAAVFSAVLAIGSVGLNNYGNVLTESKRVELQKELDREKQAEAVLAELASIISRYRGPLLESSVDLEQRLWHLATMTGEWYKAADVLCGEEIAYTLFTLVQFLGFLEVVRREGPRERAFLAAGNPQGSDTLATLVEGFRFVLCASPVTLQGWLSEPDGERDHPGARQRRPYTPVKGKRKAMTAGLGDDSTIIPLRVSRGSQRAIGSQMGATPLGSERHYTHSYSTFLGKLKAEPDFAAWLQPIEADLAALLTGPSWMGEPIAPAPHRWARVLLLQQLLVDAIDLLDPDYVRVPANRRIRLAPVAYSPLPNVEQYKAALTLLSGPMDTGRFGGMAGGGEPAPEGEHFQALQNLLHPERVLTAAEQVRRAAAAQSARTSAGAAAAAAGGGSKPGSPSGSPSGSPLGSASTLDDDAARPIVPPFELPRVGATGVQLLQALSGGAPPAPPTPPPAAAPPPSGEAWRAPPDLGGTAVTAERLPVDGASSPAGGKPTNGKR